MAKGIDIQIERLRSHFEDKLFPVNACDWFGRIFRNVKEGEVVPERFVSGRNDPDVLLNDTKDLTCFFDVQPSENYNNVFNSQVWICFSVNLVKLYPGRNPLKTCLQFSLMQLLGRLLSFQPLRMSAFECCLPVRA